jgi:hypothetical protein
VCVMGGGGYACIEFFVIGDGGLYSRGVREMEVALKVSVPQRQRAV